MSSVPGLGRSPGGGHGNPSPVFLPAESHGQRSLEDPSPWGHGELDTTEVTQHAHSFNISKVKNIRKKFLFFITVALACSKLSIY